MNEGKYHKNSLVSMVTIAGFSVAFFLVLLIIFSVHENSKIKSAYHSAVGKENPARYQQSAQEEAWGIPVLCYHYLREKMNPARFVKIIGALVLNLPLLDETEIWTQNLSAFAREMEYLKKNGYRVITLYELMQWKKGLRSLDRKSVAITFDDADKSVYRFAFPLLKKYGYRASVFVVTSHVGEEKWRGVEVMTWEELRELRESGVFTIESHSHALHQKVEIDGEAMPVFIAYANGLLIPNTPGNGKEAIRSDLEMSRELIMKETGSECRFLAWPYGFGNAKVDSMALLAGFGGICTLKAGYNYRRGGGDKNLKSIEDDIISARYDILSIEVFDKLGNTIAESRRAGEKGCGARIRRYTVTARTSIGDFKKMLRGEVRWLQEKR